MDYVKIIFLRHNTMDDEYWMIYPIAIQFQHNYFQNNIERNVLLFKHNWVRLNIYNEHKMYLHLFWSNLEDGMMQRIGAILQVPTGPFQTNFARLTGTFQTNFFRLTGFKGPFSRGQAFRDQICFKKLQWVKTIVCNCYLM